MNRNALAEATTLHDAPVPIYLMEEIANGTKASPRDAEKTADFLLGRLAKTNLTVKLKALQIISYCIREGSPAFADAIREEESEITAYLQASGPPDPVYGDEKYRRIRVASQEALVCLNDGCIPRRNDAPPAAPPANLGGNGAWGQPQQQQSYGGPQGSHANSNAYGQQQAPPAYGQSSSSYNSQPWGSSGGNRDRPAPYSDNPSGPSSYGGGGGGGYGGPSQYGGGGFGGNAATSSYSQSNPGSNGGRYDGPSQPQPSGFDSWSGPAASSGQYGPPKSAGGGVWGSGGYQKSAPPQAPTYGGGSSYSSRDTRPTVLVGHSLNFPKPTSHGNSSLIGGMGGSSSMNTYGGSAVGGGFSSGGHHQSRSNAPSYIDNMNKMLNSSSGGFGLSSMSTMQESAATSKIGKTVETLKKMGTEAKDRWDRRNMDKSIGTSLADHDELSAGPQMMDRGYFQPQSMRQGTGGGDVSGEYERGLIDSLCASVGLARAPPADALKRFVDLAQTLDSQMIGDILLDKLEDSVWQVRLKALHVVLALLESPASAPYMEIFEDNAGVFEELRSDAKPTVGAKAAQVMRALGLVGENDPDPQPVKRSSASRSNAPRGSSQATRGGDGEVDFLGFDSLNINEPPPQQHQPAPLNVYGSPRNAPAPAAPVNLLDGFDPMPQPQQPYQQPPYYQQPSHQQQQYGDLLPQSPPSHPQRQGVVPSQLPGTLDDRSKTLSNFGKDLFTIANSPRNANSDNAHTSAPAPQGGSAFSFM